MKKSILREIYNGNRGSYDTIKIKKTDTWQNAIAEVCNLFEQMKKDFSAEHFAVFKKFENSIHTLHSEEVEAFYREGFKIGVLVGMECAEN